MTRLEIEDKWYNLETEERIVILKELKESIFGARYHYLELLSPKAQDKIEEHFKIEYYEQLEDENDCELTNHITKSLMGF